MSITSEQALAASKKYTDESLEGAGGLQGKSAYQIAVDNGFVGTEEQWLESLIGEQGPQGPQGPTGPTGSQGPKGDKGDKGDPDDRSVVNVSINGVSQTVTDQAVNIDAETNFLKDDTWATITSLLS